MKELIDFLEKKALYLYNTGIGGIFVIRNYSSRYKLFDKHLNKISASTINKFGSPENVVIFLQDH